MSIQMPTNTFSTNTQVSIIRYDSSRVAWAVSVYKQAVAELPAAKKHYLVGRPDSFFAKAARKRDSALFGAFLNNKAVGLVVVQKADCWQTALDNKFVSCPDENIAAQYKNAAVGVVQCLCVHQAAKMNGIAAALIGRAQGWAKVNHCAGLVAQAARDNACGRRKFVKAGFNEVAAWTDNVNDVDRPKVLLHHALKHPFPRR